MPARISKSSTPWRWIVVGVILFLIALAIALRNTGSEPGDQSGNPGKPANAGPGKPANGRSGSGSGSLTESPDAGTSQPTRRTRSPRERTTEDDEEDTVARFPMVDVVLDDDTMTIEDSARRLREIALDATVSEAERLEAMAHGLNLDFKSFAAVVADPALPLPLAERYLEALLNHNEDPKAQVQGCLNLMNHHDEGIRTRAMEQLAFVIEQESLAASPEPLRQAAAAYLAKPPATPPVEPPAEPE